MAGRSMGNCGSLVILLFFLTIPFGSPLYFRLPSFRPNDGNITYERDAYPANDNIQLILTQRYTTSLASIGRATYSKPLRLWNKSSGNLTNFSTAFTFIIDSQDNSNYGDGLAFFLAPVGSGLPRTTTTVAGGLGLTGDASVLNSSGSPFVAVEFDIRKNKWDPDGDHVGININSLCSVVDVTWQSRIKEGRRNEALIRYDSSSMNLSVFFKGYENGLTLIQSLSLVVDLREHLPELVEFGFSGATEDTWTTHSIRSWEFNSTLEIDDENMLSPANKGKTHVGLAVGSSVGGVLLGGLGLGLLLLWKRKKLKQTEEHASFSIDGKFANRIGPSKLSYSQLVKATNNFSDQRKLGEGGFGGVYKGYLEEFDLNVAVKRVSKGSRQGIKEYMSEVNTISRLRHRNLAHLVGWCHEKRELLLVYEFMPNGSLDQLLFSGKSHLAWHMRYKIARGLASALLYLHMECEKCVLHRDIKSSNVMLDSNFEAKLGDFGLARFMDQEKGSQTTMLAGTPGYMAPECIMMGQASRQTDVYSFGVVALEIACGRRPIVPNNTKEEIRIVEWVRGLQATGTLLEAADPKLNGEFNEKEMERLLVVGLRCAYPDSNLRLSIKQAIDVLDLVAPLPTVPVEMPAIVYFGPQVDLAKYFGTLNP